MPRKKYPTQPATDTYTSVPMPIRKPEVWLAPGNKDSTNLAVIRVGYIGVYGLDVTLGKQEAQELRDQLSDVIDLM